MDVVISASLSLSLTQNSYCSFYFVFLLHNGGYPLKDHSWSTKARKLRSPGTCAGSAKQHCHPHTIHLHPPYFMSCQTYESQHPTISCGEAFATRRNPNIKQTHYINTFCSANVAPAHMWNKMSVILLTPGQPGPKASPLPCCVGRPWPWENRSSHAFGQQKQKKR